MPINHAWTVIVGTVGEIEQCVGVFDTEHEAETYSHEMRTTFYENGDAYTVVVRPLLETIEDFYNIYEKDGEDD